MNQPVDTAVNTSDIHSLKWHQTLAYGVGHIFNDLCATMWFSLLLVFLQYVCDFPNYIAGYLILLGQIADGVCTPLAGFLCDRFAGWRRLGKRKTWYLAG